MPAAAALPADRLGRPLPPLGSSPMTVKKHLEHVFAKLGVETRTAAAAMAMIRMRQLHPQFEG